MKRLLSIIFLTVFPLLTNASVYSVYTKLLKANHLPYMPIYIKSDILNTCSLACTDGHKILIAKELLSLIKNDDELAGVIGHELAHRYYSSELQADVLGLYYAQKAGYGYCKAAQFLKGFIADAKHPSGDVRYKNSGCK